MGDHFRTVFQDRLLNAHPELSSFLQHILPRDFARVRTFGWLHPAAKVRGDRVRALLRTKPLLNAKEQQAWQPPADPKAQTPDVTEVPPRGGAPLCPLCQRAMVLVGTWHAGQARRAQNGRHEYCTRRQNTVPKNASPSRAGGSCFELEKDV